jgi:hypothetical protein
MVEDIDKSRASGGLSSVEEAWKGVWSLLLRGIAFVRAHHILMLAPV